MLKISDITYSVEGRTLVEHATVTIPTGHKVGLVGRNGSGKTTLFRIIRGEMVLDTGSVSMPKGWKIGGVSQEVPGNEVSLINTVLRADTERENLLAEAETATDPARIAEVQTRLADIEAWSAEARAATILRGLGFTHQEQLMPCSAFSGGWRMRVALAAVLFSEPDLLLLDEPTNYLDLEGALSRTAPGGSVSVSGCTINGCIFGITRIDRSYGCLFDVIRCIKVRFSGGQSNNIAAFGFELIG